MKTNVRQRLKKKKRSDRGFDFIVLVAKHSIHGCIYDKALPRLCVFRKELMRIYEIETYNYKLDMALPDFVRDMTYHILLFSTCFD